MKKMIASLAFVLGAALASQAADNTAFKINGTVDPAIADAGYMIYISETVAALTDSVESIECVPVVDGKFSFETSLDSMKNGRIRAVYKDGSLAPIWADLKFIPDFTMQIVMHNGYYTIVNEAEYYKRINDSFASDNDMAIISRSDLERILNARTLTPYAKQKYVANMQKTEAMRSQLDAYKELLSILRGQWNISTLAEREILTKQMNEILKNMQTCVDSYVKMISESSD